MTVIRRYGVVHESGIMARGVLFLLDKQGVVRARWFGEPDQVLPSEPILQVARQLRAER